jgi:nicotinamidase-related amidase
MYSEKLESFRLAIGNHFITTFQNVKYRGVEVARFLFSPEFVYKFAYASNVVNEIVKSCPTIRQDVSLADAFSLVDGDYPYTVRPGKKILINPAEFLTDLAKLLPADRVITSPEPAVPNPAALEELVQTAEAELERNQNDFIFGTPGFQAWFRDWMPKVAAEIDKYADLFDREEIGCVVTRFSFTSPGRTLLWLAKSRGVPSIAYQPPVMLALNPNIGKYCPLSEIPTVATFKTVWGPQWKEFFMSFGIPEKRLPVIGNPHFDRMFSYPATNNAEFRRKFGIPESHKVILHPTELRNRMLAKVAIDAVKALPDATLLLKVRDNECPAERELYNDLIQDHPRIKVIGFDQHICDMIINSDVVLVFLSTCGVEGMLIGKPVVVMDIKYTPPFYSYVEHLGAPEVQNGEELAALLQKLFTDPLFNEEIRAREAARLPYLCVPDGQSLLRLAEFTLQVADGDYRI